MPDNESASIDKVMEAAWNQTMGEALQEVPDERHHLGEAPEPKQEPVKAPEENTGADTQPTGEDPSVVLEGTQPESAEAPKHWSEADRQTFAKLDKEGQTFLLRRHREMEADYTRKTQEHSETVKIGRQVSQYLDSGVRQGLQSAGMNDEQFIGSLLQYHRLSVVDPEKFLRITAENLGLDPAKVFAQQPAAQPQSTDPVSQRVEALEKHINSENARRQQQMQQEARSTMEAFAGEMDSSGRPLRPHFEKVRATMGRLMLADPTLDLAQAYEVAVFRDPELRSSVVPPIAVAPASSPLNDRKVKEAAAAVAANRSNIRTTAAAGAGAVKKPGGKLSIRDAISAAADEVGFNN